MRISDWSSDVCSSDLPDCPYPGIALALSGDALTDADIQRSAVLGCVHFLRRPFCPEAVARGLAQWPLDRTDFIVSGSYSGPDRRRASRQEIGRASCRERVCQYV